MNYEQFKQELSQIELTRDLVSCGYISYLDKENELKKLNPAFGYSVGEYGGVHSINWYVSGNDWSNGQFNFCLTICTRDYKDKRLYEKDGHDWSNGAATFHADEQHDLTDKQRAAVVAYIKEWHAKKLAEIAAKYERGKQEMSVEDLQKECEKIANEILKGKKDKYGNPMRARLAVGKRGCDNESKPYTALCIEYYGNVFGRVDWHNECSMTFGKDKYGINHITYRAPLCGESSGEFDMDYFKQYVASCLR